MHRKCNVHITELGCIFENIFSSINDKIRLSFNLHILPTRKVPTLNINSSLGQQIAYYRTVQRLKQVELAKKVGVSRDCILNIENKVYKIVDVELINKILEELKIKNKIKFNDDYLEFIFNEPHKKIVEYRKKYGLTRFQLAQLIGSQIGVIKKWELKIGKPSRKSFQKLKILSNFQEKKC